jgi:hypothetical protein
LRNFRPEVGFRIAKVWLRQSRTYVSFESRQQAAKGSRSKGGILEHRFLMLATVPGSTAVAAADTLDPVWTLLSYGSFTA